MSLSSLIKAILEEQREVYEEQKREKKDPSLIKTIMEEQKRGEKDLEAAT